MVPFSRHHMTRASLAGWSIASGFLLLAVLSGRQAVRDDVDPRPNQVLAGSAAIEPVPSAGLLYGRVTTTDGVVHEGRLRFGGDEEALWSHYFNGRKVVNPWAESAPSSALVRTQPREIAGIGFGSVERKIDLERPFMVRLGDIARIDAERRTLSVTLRSGDVVTLDRFEADDFADGIRVWHDTGMVDLDEWSIRSVEFVSPPEDMTGPAPLRGIVRTSSDEFAGLLQWDREEAFVTDLLEGIGREGEPVSIRFAGIAAIERVSATAIRVVPKDGGRVVMTDLAGPMPHRGIYVDDARYGRVLVSWDAVETVVLGTDGDTAPPPPDFGAFTGGIPLSGTVTTRSGERLAGRLVYDLDESRTIETLDAPWEGVDYTIPFGLVASIQPAALYDEPGATGVTLRSGEVLSLEPEGDLGPQVAGVLIFPAADGEATAGRSSGGAADVAGAKFVPWSEVARVDFERDGAASMSRGG